MPFKALNNREKDKAEHSYIHSHITKHLNFTVKSKRSQSALEYMMTYGWAILIIVIVAVILYSIGIFNPSSSVSSTVIGFSGLGSVTAQCTANGVLRISVGDSTGNLINITGITAKDPAITKISNFKPNSTVDPNPLIRSGSSYIFSVPNICPSAGTHYAITVAVNYTEPGQPIPGPYQSLGSITGSTDLNYLPSFVPVFNGVNSGINANAELLPNSSKVRTVLAWFSTKEPANVGQPGIFGYGAQVCAGHFFWAFIYQCAANGIQIDTWCTCQTVVAPPIKLNNWYFIAFEYNGTDQIGYGGPLDGSLSLAFSPQSINTTTSSNPTFYIGDIINRNDWNGSIVNVQVYDTPLSVSEISKIYSEGIAAPPIPNAGLVSWWPLNGTTKNYIQTNNNGVPSNIVYTTNYPG